MADSWKTGGCHCGAVTWRANVGDTIIAHACNCSICEMTGFQHVIIPKSKFELLTGEDELTQYRFNTGAAAHYFCRRCGVKSFYTPRSNPDGYSLNLRAMDPAQFKSVTIEPFDGRNWEENAGALAHLSRDDG